MATKRKADNISRDGHLAGANGFDHLVPPKPNPAAGERPCEQHFPRQAKLIKFLPINLDAVTEAAKTLNEVAKQNMSTEEMATGPTLNPASGTHTAKDARCVTCQKEGLVCDMTSPRCGPCKRLSLECVYSQDGSLDCIRCEHLRNTGEEGACDLQYPVCSQCRRTNALCSYATNFPESWCLPCRQPGRSCDQQRPKCSTCMHEKLACGYTDNGPDVEIVDLESDSGKLGEAEYEVERILKHRSRRKGIEYLVKWIGYDLDETTWEPKQNLTGSEEIIQEYHHRLSQKVPGSPRRPVLKVQEKASTASPKQQAKIGRPRGRPPSQQKVRAIASDLPVPQKVVTTSPSAESELAALKAKVAMLEARLQESSPDARSTAPRPSQPRSIPQDLEHIVSSQRNNGRDEYLVRWKGCGPEADTWVSASSMSNATGAVREYQMRVDRGLVRRKPQHETLWKEHISKQQTASSRDDPRTVHIGTDLFPRTAIVTQAHSRRIPQDIKMILNRAWNAQNLVYLVRWQDGGSDTWESHVALANAQEAIRAYTSAEQHGTASFTQALPPQLASQDSLSRTPQGGNGVHMNTGQNEGYVHSAPTSKPSYSFIGGLSSASRNASMIGRPSTALHAAGATGGRDDSDTQRLTPSRPAPSGQAAPQAASAHGPPEQAGWRPDDKIAGAANFPSQPPRDLTTPEAADVVRERKGGSKRRALSSVIDLTDDKLIETGVQQHQSSVAPRHTNKSSPLSREPRKRKLNSEFHTRSSARPPQRGNECHISKAQDLHKEDGHHRDFTASIQDTCYLLLPEKHQLSERPLPCGLYTKHTVASNVLLAMGKHPWLFKLNARLEGLLDRDGTGRLLEHGIAQHRRAMGFQNYMDGHAAKP